MKCCSRCKLEKPLSDFNKLVKSTDGRQPRCRPCQKEVYLERRDLHLASVRASRASRKGVLVDIVTKLKSEPCTDCDMQYHPFQMDFDHIGDDKAGNISVMVNEGVPVEKLMQEISKCELVCANCHRMRTWNRISSPRGPMDRAAAF